MGDPVSKQIEHAAGVKALSSIPSTTKIEKKEADREQRGQLEGASDFQKKGGQRGTWRRRQRFWGLQWLGGVSSRESEQCTGQVLIGTLRSFGGGRGQS